jgi:adenylate kinase family enzyme
MSELFSEFSGVVVILRGLPGSGKSTIAHNLAEESGCSIVHICSADDYFVDKFGNYRFNHRELSRAHNACMTKFLKLLIARAPFIAIDNTHIEQWEYENYILAAALAGYKVQIKEIICHDESSVEKFCKRNQHGVPLDKCIEMWRRFRHDPRAECISSTI